MYKIGDIYNTNLTKKPTETVLPVHMLHQHRDQVTGIEQRKSIARKKRRDMTARINLNLRNKKIATLARNFLENNKPIKTSESLA